MFILRYIKIVFIFSFFIFLPSNGKAEMKVAFVEMNILLSQSVAGKSLTEQINIIDKKNREKFNAIKNKLEIEKKDLLKKKNILSTDEYKNKITDLNKNFNFAQADIKNKISVIQSKRNEGMKKILNELNILLSEYSNKNQLSFIIDHKNIIIGKTDLNITGEILKSLNKKMPKIDIN